MPTNAHTEEWRLPEGGVDEARPAAFLGVAVQRELRDHEHAAPDLGEIAIHLAFVIPKRRKTEDLVRHPVERGIGIGRRNPASTRNPRPISPTVLPSHPNGGAGDALQDDPHSTVTLFARFLGWSTLHPRRTAM